MFWKANERKAYHNMVMRVIFTIVTDIIMRLSTNKMQDMCTKKSILKQLFCLITLENKENDIRMNANE